MKPIVLLFLLYANIAFAQIQITHKGNNIDFDRASKVEIIDPVTGKSHMTPIPPAPARLNGEKIYSTYQLSELPLCKQGNGKPTPLASMMFDSLKALIAHLDDGEYIVRIRNMIVDKNGHLAYYDFGGIQQLIPHAVSKTKMHDGAVVFSRVEKTQSDKTIPPTLKKVINERARILLDQLPAITPGKINGTAVNCVDEPFSMATFIKVTHHKAMLEAI